MAKIIDINQVIKTQTGSTGRAKKDAHLVRINDTRPDSFERTRKTPEVKGLSIEEMGELVGERETQKLFSSIFGDSNSFEIDFTSKGSAPLNVSLKEVWDFSNEAKEKRLKKADEISRTRRALRSFERKCSARYEDAYGKEADIRLKLSTKNEIGEEEVVYITDALMEQEEFYRKNKVMASIHLIKQRMEYLDEMERFKDHFEDNYLDD